MTMETEDIDQGAERNTANGLSATSITQKRRVLEWLIADGHWIDCAILILAAVLRMWALDIKPAHFDEGVNGLFVDDMTKHGYYHYDPTNFHGPLHFYILFAAQTLLGRHIWVLRLPLALAGIGCVGLAMFGFRRFFEKGTCRLAALALAVSPGFVFYARYAIHETWLAFFLMLLTLGIGRLWLDGERRSWWTIGIGLAGAVLIKETWIIHVVAMLLAAVTLRAVEWITPSSSLPWAQPRWTFDDAARVAAVCGGMVLFIYSGFLLDPPGLRGFAQAFINWTRTGLGDSGHDKPWYYWWQLLSQYEWPALLGLVASPFILLPGTNRFLRWVAIFGGGTLAAYSIIAYKTPWCLIAWAWPFYFVFGAAVVWMARHVDRGVFGGITALVLLLSFSKARSLSFVNYADETEPYVYVQTTNDIRLLLDPLRWQVERDPESLFHPGHILMTELFPLKWLLGDRPKVTFGGPEDKLDTMDADWLLVDKAGTDRVEDQLKDLYFRTKVRVRGMSPDESVLYLRASIFAPYFPSREPEFDPAFPRIHLNEPTAPTKESDSE
jgi:uncharacterized protein (TIGR03663 family)